jgi:porin
LRRSRHSGIRLPEQDRRAWYSNVDAADVFFDVNHNPRVITALEPLQHNSRGKPVSGVGLFLNATQADKRASITDNQIALGIFWKPRSSRCPTTCSPSPSAGRTSTAASGMARCSTRRIPSHRLPNMPPSSITARTRPTGSRCGPNVQYIHKPGGRSDAHDVGVLGLKFGVTL